MHIWLRAALHSVDAHWSDHEKSKCCWPKVTTNSRRSMTQIYSTAYVFSPSWLQKSISDICTFLLNYSYRAKTMSRKISCGNIWLNYNYYWDDFYEEKMFFLWCFNLQDFCLLFFMFDSACEEFVIFSIPFKLANNFLLLVMLRLFFFQCVCYIYSLRCMW